MMLKFKMKMISRWLSLSYLVISGRAKVTPQSNFNNAQARLPGYTALGLSEGLEAHVRHFPHSSDANSLF